MTPRVDAVTPGEPQAARSAEPVTTWKDSYENVLTHARAENWKRVDVDDLIEHDYVCKIKNLDDQDRWNISWGISQKILRGEEKDMSTLRILNAHLKEGKHQSFPT